jgi:hypothetical protein
VLAAVGYAGNCQDTCSWRGLASAAGQGAEHGAELGAIFGLLGSASAIGRSCTHSFAPETPVLLADGGTKPIKDVAVNDRVVATDPDTGQTAAEPVTDLHLNRDTDLTDVTVAAAVGIAVGSATATLHTTQHHPFWDNTSGTWVDAKDLVAGHELRGPDGTGVQVVAVHNFAGAQYMRDLTVADVHTYYVVAGTTPVLVHNCDSVVLGVNPHSDNLAMSLRNAGEDLQAQTFNRGNYGRLSPTNGRPEWMNKVADAIRTPGTRLRVTLDGLPGDTAEEALKNAYTRGMPLHGGNWRAAAAFGNGTAWEIGSLASEVKAGAREWSSVMFYWKGK